MQTDGAQHSLDMATQERFAQYFDQNLPPAQRLLGNLGSMADTNVGNLYEIANAVILQTSLGIAASFMKPNEFTLFSDKINQADSPLKKQALLRAEALIIQADQLETIDPADNANKALANRLRGSGQTLKLAAETNSLPPRIQAPSPMTTHDTQLKQSPFTPDLPKKLVGTSFDFKLLDTKVGRLTRPKPVIQLHA